MTTDAASAMALLERARNGDADAFGALAEEHRASLMRLCYKMTGSPEEAEDLVQETLLKAYTHIQDFEVRASLSTWLHRIASNACLDHQRSRKPWDLEKRWQWFRENGELQEQLEQNLYMSPERSAESMRSQSGSVPRRRPGSKPCLFGAGFRPAPEYCSARASSRLRTCIPRRLSRIRFSPTSSPSR